MTSQTSETGATLALDLIDPIALAALRGRLAGELLLPGEAAYEQARHIANRRFDSAPAAVVRAARTSDVAAAVAFAREQGLEIAVRSGGHSIPGHSTGDGVLVVDLSQMKGIGVDRRGGLAHVQPGVTNGELVQALAAYGLATTTGTCASVGMGGSTLGGGIGWLMGRFGATVDNVAAFEVVTAEGEVLVASAERHPDLFWALRGGGGNFGVVTEIAYRVHPLGPVLGGMLLFPLAAAPLALKLYRHITAQAPDELVMHAVMATVPDFGPALVLQAVYSGEDLAEGERLLAPARRFGPPAADLVAARSYAEAYMMMTPPLPPGASWFDTSYSLVRPSDAALDDMLATALDRPTPMAVVNVHQFHGAAARVAPGATALALREEHYAVANIAMWMGGDGAAERAWALAAKERMAPHASAGVYVNFLGDEGDAAVRASYRANYARLQAVKAHYDPENVFRRNQNIRPA